MIYLICGLAEIELNRAGLDALAQDLELVESRQADARHPIDSDVLAQRHNALAQAIARVRLSSPQISVQDALSTARLVVAGQGL
jgi:hypothetical protein